MIVTILPNTNPTSYEGASHKEDIVVVSRNEQVIEAPFNVCDQQCPYVEPKFSESGAITKSIKNDKTDLLQNLSITTDTVVYKLFKCEDGENIEKATLNNSTYGTYFPASFFPDQLKIGFLADWNKIFNTLGHGRYYFVIERVIFGQILTDLTSWFYDLELYSDQAANDTVRIEASKSGCIEGGFDYSGFTWFTEIRFRGMFGRPTRNLNKDHFLTQQRRDEQIIDSMIKTYSMQIELVPTEVITPFLDDTIMANDIFITSYSFDAFLTPYVKFNVVTEEPQDPEYFDRNINGLFEITFKDKFARPVKSN